MWERRRDSKLEQTRKKLFEKLSRRLRSNDVVQAMKNVPRERFVPADDRHVAYLDIPLAIGGGQTISQPYIVGLMTEALQIQPNDRVLEVGTGSGYQAAVLAELAHRGAVVTVERRPELAARAEGVLRGLGYQNLSYRLSGKVLGCPEDGPYDAIIVTAAAPKLPPSLLDQLALGGRMVVPVGTLEQQELVLALRTGEGYSLKMLGPCRFVPLLGPDGFPSAQGMGPGGQV